VLFLVFPFCQIKELKKGDNMARPTIWIPLEDVKGLKTLVAEGKTQDEIADYYIPSLTVKSNKSVLSSV
jgi:hypothetical protein